MVGVAHGAQVARVAVDVEFDGQTVNAAALVRRAAVGNGAIIDNCPLRVAAGDGNAATLLRAAVVDRAVFDRGLPGGAADAATVVIGARVGLAVIERTVGDCDGAVLVGAGFVVAVEVCAATAAGAGNAAHEGAVVHDHDGSVGLKAARRVGVAVGKAAARNRCLAAFLVGVDAVEQGAALVGGHAAVKAAVLDCELERVAPHGAAAFSVARDALAVHKAAVPDKATPHGVIIRVVVIARFELASPNVHRAAIFGDAIFEVAMLDRHDRAIGVDDAAIALLADVLAIKIEALDRKVGGLDGIRVADGFDQRLLVVDVAAHRRARLQALLVGVRLGIAVCSADGRGHRDLAVLGEGDAVAVGHEVVAQHLNRGLAAGVSRSCHIGRNEGFGLVEAREGVLILVRFGSRNNRLLGIVRLKRVRHLGRHDPADGAIAAKDDLVSIAVVERGARKRDVRDIGNGARVAVERIRNAPLPAIEGARERPRHVPAARKEQLDCLTWLKRKVFGRDGIERVLNLVVLRKHVTKARHAGRVVDGGVPAHGKAAYRERALRAAFDRVVLDRDVGRIGVVDDEAGKGTGAAVATLVLPLAVCRTPVDIGDVIFEGHGARAHIGRGKDRRVVAKQLAVVCLYFVRDFGNRARAASGAVRNRAFCCACGNVALKRVGKRSQVADLDLEGLGPTQLLGSAVDRHVEVCAVVSELGRVGAVGEHGKDGAGHAALGNKGAVFVARHVNAHVGVGSKAVARGVDNLVGVFVEVDVGRRRVVALAKRVARDLDRPAQVEARRVVANGHGAARACHVCADRARVEGDLATV